LGVDVVIDLSEIAFMDSTVLSVLVHASEEAASQQRAFAVVAETRTEPPARGHRHRQATPHLPGTRRRLHRARNL
jgi:STAS domain-containing protein